MLYPPDGPPPTSGGGDDGDAGSGGPVLMQGKDASRSHRLRAALRENLKRRKAQARARADGPRPAGQDCEAAPAATVPGEPAEPQEG